VANAEVIQQAFDEGKVSIDSVLEVEMNIDADAIRYGVGRHRRFARAGQRITQCSQRRTQGEE
jgi:hypothetical protein